MNASCQKVWDALERGAAIEAGLQDHAATCPTCQATGHLFGQRPATAPAPLAEARSELGALARSELRAHPAARAWWTGAAIVFALELVCAFGAVLALAHGQLVGNLSSALRLRMVETCRPGPRRASVGRSSA